MNLLACAPRQQHAVAVGENRPACNGSVPFVVICCVWALVSWWAPLPTIAAENLIHNGTFSEWQDGVPVGWKLEVGARSGSDVESRVQQNPAGGLRLQGDAQTGVWRSVSQSFAVEPGQYYRIQFQAQTRGLRREGRQFNNCYVGIMLRNNAGERLSLAFRDLFETETAPGYIIAQVPDKAVDAVVMVFLSKSGQLDVGDVRVERLSATDSFDVLVADMDRYYSFFQHKQIDWKSLAQPYRATAMAADDADEFVNAVKPLLAKLGDLHVTLQLPTGKQVGTHTSPYSANFNYQHVAKQLQQVRQIGRAGFVGRTAEGYGYAAIGTLAGKRESLQALISAITELRDAPAMLIDIRANNGGDERVAQQIASMFTDKRLVYAKSRVRSGVGYDDLTPPSDRLLLPGKGPAYVKPIACLIGPGCVSSGEGFALMMQALPNVTMLGQPTRGASGNPAPVSLPNGVTVSYSRWLSLTPGGTIIEGRGVIPEIKVDHKPNGDGTFDAAVQHLNERVRAAGR